MSQQTVPTVVVADSNRLFLEAFMHLVQSEAIVVGTATDADELLELVEKLAPEVVVTDLMIPGIRGCETIRRICAMPNAASVIILTGLCDPAHVMTALDSGARGFVAKSCAAEDLRAAIRVVARGGTYRSPVIDPPCDNTTQSAVGIKRLTHREREVLSLMASGMKARAIAQRLGITERTVAFHKDRMKARLGVTSTVELVNFLVRSEYVGH